MTQENGRTEGTSSPAGAARTAVGIALLAALVATVYGRALATLWLTWMTNPNYSHGYLIPPVAAFLIWRERRRFAESVGRGTVWGLLLVGLALLAHLMSIRAGVFMTQGYSLVLLVFGVVLYLFGGRATRTVWFGIAYLVFMLPMPPFLMNVVSFQLKVFAARVGSGIAAKMGIPLVRSGMTIHMPAGSLRIADPCSGLRSLIALVALGALFAYLTKGPLWKRIVLFASALPLAVIANVIRIGVLCAVANVWGVDAALGFFHDFSGVLLFLIAFAGLAVVRKLLRFSEPEEDSR